MCASVCPSEALWYGTIERVRRHPPRFVVPRLHVRPPRGAHQGVHRRRRPRRRARSTCSPAPTTWLDDPFGLERWPGRRMTDVDRSDGVSRSGDGTSPTRRWPRRRSPAASSPATSSSAPARWPPPTSGSRYGPSCAASTPVNPEPIVALERRRRRRHLPVPLPGRSTTRRSSSASPTATSSRSARSAPTSAASSTTSPRSSAGTARATRATSTPAPERCISGPPTRPLGRIDVEVRDDGMIWALGRRDMRASDARPAHIVRGLALRHHPRRVPGVPHHRRRRGVPDRRRVPRLGDRRGLGRARRRLRRCFLRYLRP